LLTPQEIIQRLKPCTWKYNSIKDLGDKTHFGFIAQEVLETFGSDYNFVDTSEEYLKINYFEFIAPLVKVVQNQDLKIKELEERILQLESTQRNKDDL
jgi:hypothetical protein